MTAQKSTTPQKAKQLTIDEYNKIKDKITKAKLKLTFPWIIKAAFIIPFLYLAFLLIYYLLKIRFLTQH